MKMLKLINKKQLLSLKQLMVLSFGIFSVLLLSACSQKSMVTPITASDFYFDTVVSITVYDEQDEKYIQECFDICKHYEELFSKTIEESEVSKINSEVLTEGLSDETIDIIKKGLDFSEKTNGMFDISILPLSNLWDVLNENPHIPSKEAINNALELVDYSSITVDGNAVINANQEQGAGIDLGGIAKGYIGDCLKEYLVKNGVESALIALGGNIILVGEKPGADSYTVGIQKPFAKTGEAEYILKLKDKSAVTSGTYERYFEKDGRIYHHIIDTTTGEPVNNELTSVTVVSDSSLLGDEYSTVLLELGLEKGMIEVESCPDIEAVFIDYDGNVSVSSGLELNSDKLITLKNDSTNKIG